MRHNKSIFKKYFRTSMFIILISFLILGIMTVTSMIRYWKNEKHYLFSKNAYGIAEFIERNSAIIDNGLYLYNENLLKTFLSTFASNLNADIFISDSSGKIIMDSLRTEDHYINKRVSKRIVSMVRSGQYEELGNLDGIYKNKNYVVALPINSSDMRMMGAVFICTEAENFLEFYKNILSIFIIASVIALMISFWIVKWLSYSLTEPLRQISDVAERVGKEDFSSRVQIKSNDEIGKLAEVFNDMTDSLSRSEQVRRNFISNVSHELKTPMTTISGFVDGILDGTIENDKQKHYLNIVSSEIKRLSRLVRTMLDLSKIDNENIKLNFKDVNIPQIILSVLITFESYINNKNVEIKGLNKISNVIVEADEDMIYQVLYNLIDNAVKFTENGGYIKIDLVESNNKLIVSIKNSGMGIPEEDIDFIFDKFYKTDKSRSIDKKGLGLGLYIVKRILKLHGGDVRVRSKSGSYTQFDLYLPKKHS